jgi:hypothetical protein
MSLITAIIISTAAGIIAGMYVQTRLNLNGYAARWIDAAKIGRAVQEFFGPLEIRVTNLEKEHSHFLALINTQDNHAKHSQDEHDEDRAELRVVKVDRDRILGERLAFQKKADVVTSERNGLVARIAQLESEITRLMSQSPDDTGGFDTTTLELKQKARGNE